LTPVAAIDEQQHELKRIAEIFKSDYEIAMAREQSIQRSRRAGPQKLAAE
jgi:hypothetical protein